MMLRREVRICRVRLGIVRRFTTSAIVSPLVRDEYGSVVADKECLLIFDQWTEGANHGFASLAQRAKAAARRLARKKGTTPCPKK
jgi:hypothetical protein